MRTERSDRAQSLLRWAGLSQAGRLAACAGAVCSAFFAGPVMTLADGGAGGAGQPGASGGAGGTGTGGTAGGVGGPGGSAAGGGGGGGSGGGAGGSGGIGNMLGLPNNGGAGGTAGSPNGVAGGASVSTDALGAGGGGGGYHGSGPSIVSLANFGALIGGNGGSGGSNFLNQNTGGGGGGAGGYGAIVTGAGAASNSGTIQGGRGGNGGALNSHDGAAGSGGIGIKFNAAGVVFTNSGTVAGADGGTGSTVGLGGVGIQGFNLTIINSGTITGGRTGANPLQRVNAIEFVGTSNRLELLAGSSITGVVNAGGVNDVLAVASMPGGSFDLQNIGPGSQYRNFEVFEKTSPSVLALANTTSQLINWSIVGGTLAVQFDSTLGDPAGNITLNGGALQVGSSSFLSTNRQFTIGAAGGAVDVQNAFFQIFSLISGPGVLTKRGPGTLVPFALTNSYGGATIEGGVLSIGADGQLGAPGAGITLNGGELHITSDVFTGRPVTLAGPGTITVASNTTLSIGGSISGPGSLTKGQLGTLGINAASNTILGATFVEQGVVAINATSAFSSAGVHLGSLDHAFATIEVNGFLNAGPFMTVGDNLPGTGFGGNGTLNINNGGGVALGTNAKLTVGWVNAAGVVTLNTGGTLQVGGTDGIQKHATGTATFALAGGTIQVIGSNLTSAMDMVLTNAPTVHTAGLNATLSGNLSGAGSLTKIGAGTLTLAGNAAHGGGTTVSSGILRINGSTSSVAAAANTSVGGSGTIASLTLQPGATITPGPATGAPGMLTVGSGVNLSGSTLLVDITGHLPGNNYDLLLVNSGNVDLGAGATTLSFGTLSTTGVAFLQTDRVYIVVNAGPGATTGTFAGLPDNGAAGTLVPALNSYAGFPRWRLYYHADSSAGALTGGNDIALVPNCAGDFNNSGAVTVQDIFDFLAAYFANDPSADFNGVGGVSVQDIFDFLAAYFAGC